MHRGEGMKEEVVMVLRDRISLVEVRRNVLLENIRVEQGGQTRAQRDGKSSSLDDVQTRQRARDTRRVEGPTVALCRQHRNATGHVRSKIVLTFFVE